jgi:hypothetical protein
MSSLDPDPPADGWQMPVDDLPVLLSTDAWHVVPSSL